MWYNTLGAGSESSAVACVDLSAWDAVDYGTDLSGHMKTAGDVVLDQKIMQVQTQITNLPEGYG